MKIYKLLTKGRNSIPIEGEEELNLLLENMNKGAKVVILKHGIVDVSSIDSIVANREAMKEINDYASFGHTREEAVRNVLGSPVFSQDKKLSLE